MDDGLRVPGLADGMHAFPGAGGMTVLVRNHELNVGDRQHAFAGLGRIPEQVRELMFDPAVGAGGVTTLVIDPDSSRLTKQFLSLAGTLRNCAGGATPWGSWLSCEESVVSAGYRGATQNHGFAFEVPSSARRLQAARPLTAMGRFNREAVALDPATGIAYQTEDREDGLFYRFIPGVPGDLAAGGRLQALAIVGMEGLGTGNRSGRRVPLREPLKVRWVPVREPESPGDDLRMQGVDSGATTFVRGEGMAVETVGGSVCVWFKCTAGGPSGLGQIWCYRPSPGEGSDAERRQPGTLELFLEPGTSALMNQGDNLALAPGGDLLVCEDNATDQRIRGVTRDGGVYAVARNPRSNSEFAGATFSPDGKVLYVNLQLPGLTFAIRGPWGRRLAVPHA
jgi:secreted PhoX family phosphatase